MNWDRVRELAGKVRSTWGRLTEDEVSARNNRIEEDYQQEKERKRQDMNDYIKSLKTRSKNKN